MAGRFEVMTRENRLITVSGSLDFEQGEILWGKFFGDLKSQKPSLDFDGDYLAASDELQLRKLNLSLATMGKVGLSGNRATNLAAADTAHTNDGQRRPALGCLRVLHP